MSKRLLLSWIGHYDLRVMAADLPGDKAAAILAEIHGKAVPGESGPIKALLNQVEFDSVVLLTNFSGDASQCYVQWLAREIRLVQVTIASPTDYESIFRAVDRQLSELREVGLLQTHELCIHLSPGSPAMVAVSLLLGKSKYPATFYQSYQERAWITKVPFDLAVDFLPDLYAAPDKHLQHLASQSPGEVAGFEGIVGDSPQIRTAVGRAKRAAVRSVPVLLLGESGVGKEMFARAIHEASARSQGPFVAINCAAIAKDLLESQLFGHARGAFTGADRDRQGAFAEADKGTLFLDEIGECDLDLQAKLLRVLQPPFDKSPCHRIFRPVGASQDLTSDVRVIAATNRDLVQALTQERFREDLYYRLAVITISIPPLRERQGDLPRVCAILLERINTQLAAEGEPGYRRKTLSASALSLVKQRPWPGNIRQLHNVLLQAAVMCDGDTLDKPDLLEALAEMPQLAGDQFGALNHPLGDGFHLEEHLNQIQRHYLERAMAEARGVKAEASRLLGIANYQTLDAQLKRLNVSGDWC